MPDGAGASRTVVARRSGPQEEKLGTAHGIQETSVITMVSFERASSIPDSVRQIEYDTQAHLIAKGIIPVRNPPPHPPHAFPQRPYEPGFVPDPPGGF